jgi:polysaccharide export outer membrane protein
MSGLKIGGMLGVALLAALLGASGAAAQGAETTTTAYRLGVGDVVRLNVLAQPELDGELTVQPDSTVFVPRVGELAVGGLTVAEAERLIQQRLRLYDPDVTTVTLIVTEYNSLQIFVLGAVANAGPQTFTTPPTLWDVLRAAGGPTDGANLASARVVSTEDGLPVTHPVNLSGWMSGGEIPNVTLGNGDTLIIPGGVDGTATGTDPAGGVQIFGGVASPTTVPITEPTRLLTCLMLAGAPIEDANLEKVWWVHHDGGEQIRSRRVDMRNYFEQGSMAGNPLIYPGDSVRVEEHRLSWFQQNWGLIMATLTTFITIYLLVDRGTVR